MLIPINEHWRIYKDRKQWIVCRSTVTSGNKIRWSNVCYWNSLEKAINYLYRRGVSQQDITAAIHSTTGLSKEKGNDIYRHSDLRAIKNQANQVKQKMFNME